MLVRYWAVAIGLVSALLLYMPVLADPTFTIEVVDAGPDDVGKYASLDLDEEGHLAVTYYDQTTGELQYAVKESTWLISTIDDLRDVGQYSSLAIDSTGRQNVSYYDADEGALKYSGWIEPAWTSSIELVDGGPDYVGQYSSLVLDEAGHLAVSYYNETTRQLRYAVKNPTWLISTIDDLRDVGQYSSLAIDSSGRQNVSYYDADEGALKYSGWIEPAWTSSIELVDGGPDYVGQYSSLVLDEAGHLAVSYYNETTRQLRYAVKDPTWLISTVDDLRDVGQYSSLAIDSSGRQNVSYYDADEGALKYSGWIVPAWTSSIELVDGGPNDVGQYSSLELDEGGNLAVAYYDQTTGDLRYAVKDPTWFIGMIDNLRDVGQYVSLAIDSAGRQNVSYYDADEGALKYSGWVVPAWTASIELVDGGPTDVGQYCSLALNGCNSLAVAYYDATMGDLMFASRIPASPMGYWITERVDGQYVDVGQYACLQMRGHDAHISYYDASYTSLKYAGGVATGPASVPETPVAPAPVVWCLHSPQPCPFSRRARLGLDVPRTERVCVAVFDISGRLVTNLHEGSLDAGWWHFEWDGRDRRGNQAAPGIYFVSVSAETFSDTAKLILIR